MVVGEFTQETQLVVIGGGPGGYAAAFRAAELGVETFIVDERDTLGGVCLHHGCIPSKTLLHMAEIINSGEHARQFGIHFEQPRLDVAAMRGWVEQTVAQLAKGLDQLRKRHKVERIQGRAVFDDARNVTVRGDQATAHLRFRRAIIATGSKPLTHPALPFDGDRVLTPSDALNLVAIPQSVLIVGHNYMAVEQACLYQALGSRVTLVDEAETMLPEVDADLARPMMRRLTDRISEICVGVRVDDADISASGVTVTFGAAKDGAALPRETTFDAVIVAVGQKGNTEGLGLEKTHAATDEHGFLSVDDHLRTSEPRLLAVGDVTGGLLLADRALLQGRIAGEVVAGWNSHLDYRALPAAIFTDPQIAWCGLSENQARARGVPHEVSKVPWGASGRAVGMGRTDGITKIIYEPDTKLILGVGITGTNAAEMIAEGALAIEMGAVVTDLAGTIHPHPTLSELISDAAQQIEDPEE